jgi:aspartate/methionine/tyrosine aminotransferase
MQIEIFELERVQSLWENRVEFNLTESGVHPYTLNELLEEKDVAALADLRLGYGQTNGSIVLRESIAALYPGAGSSNVVVTNGSAEANFVAAWSTLDDGDEIVYMVPNYLQIRGISRAMGVTVRPLSLRAELGWQPDLDELDTLVTPRTKVIAICNPNNPTGMTLSDEAMNAIVSAAQRCGAWLFVDEVYRGAELDGKDSASFWGRYDRLVITGGLSKAYALPGLRLGWLVGPAEFIEAAWARTDYTSIAPGILSDEVARFALQPSLRASILERNRSLLRDNLATLQAWMAEQPVEMTLTPPKAGGMAFVRYHLDMNSTELTTRLREEKSVLIVAGDCFGLDGYLRIGFGADPEYLHRGLERIGEFLDECRSQRM